MAAALDQNDFPAAISAFRDANPFPGLNTPTTIANAISDEDKAVVFERAAKAMEREVDFLGSGPHKLGTPIDWPLDFKSGTRWAMRASHRLQINDLGNPSDIKVIWELSRLQWLLPVGQAYLLDRDEARAEFARVIIEEWLVANPVCAGPNWICAMDVALRAVSMIWLAQAFRESETWRDPVFQQRLIKTLILHGRFIDGNLEFADVNGNHLTADLAGLVIIGIALGGRGLAGKWADKGWRILCEEFPSQVPEDGVCREGSLPYHRLVAELFLLPALARRNVGLNVDNEYVTRLRKMGVFSATATAPDGDVPVWGDADDGRALPLGSQRMNDHRYLFEMMDALSHVPEKPKHDETAWWFGAGNAVGSTRRQEALSTHAFTDSGVFILRGPDEHVFVDAGPVGMNGRGGHGHNDCLSFTASLDGTPLVVDPGSYVYTSDFQARNRFRSTFAHNTPGIDGEEINRFNPRQLWRLSNDAVPEVRHWSTSSDVDLLVAAHTGYQHLSSPVTPVRGFMLERSTHRLFVADGFEGTGTHEIRIPYTFAPGALIEFVADGVWRIERAQKSFALVVSNPANWQATLGETSISPSYGIVEKAPSLTLSRTGPLLPLAVVLMPTSRMPPDPVRWLRNVVAGRFPVPGFKA